MSEPKEKSGSSFGFWGIVILLFVIGLLVAIAMPNFNSDGRKSPALTCINNLRQIDAAANQFALENRKTNGEAINFPDDLTPYIKLNNQGKIPGCPGGGI